MKRNFLLCGSLGWCLEVFWTGLHSLLNGQLTMMGQTSLLMFPIYGCAAVIAPLYHRLASIPAAVRGCLYTVGIFVTEFFAGSFLKHLGIIATPLFTTEESYAWTMRRYGLLPASFLRKYFQNHLEKTLFLLYH